ncbi:MAG: hypothetical protein E6H08_15285 [Bacteroidetes bacterium]|nr:MAG: hypothetical protein E6H08_15285 [Bacteroidota bacterium]
MKKHTLIILILAFFSIAAFAQSDKPLIVVNGIAIDRNANFIDSIPVDQIDALKIYGATEAIEKYGEFLGSTGIIEIKTKPNEKGYIKIPKEFRLSYGNKKPIFLLNGKVTEYEKLNDTNANNLLSIEVNNSIDFVKKYGLQSINGLVCITSK